MNIKSKNVVTIIFLTILHLVMTLWAANWVFTLASFTAIGEIILSFKKLKEPRFKRGLILFLLVILNFISIIWAAGGEFTPLAFMSAVDIMVAFEKIDSNDVSDSELVNPFLGGKR